MSETVEACDGKVCVNCCKCQTCGRKIGQRHLDVCACETANKHYYCEACK